MIIVNGNGAKAHETQVKWRNGWCQDSVVKVAWLLREPGFLTHISNSNKASNHLPRRDPGHTCKCTTKNHLLNHDSLTFPGPYSVAIAPSK